MSTAIAVSPIISDSIMGHVVRPWWTCWASLHWGFREFACVLWCCQGRVPVNVAYEHLGIESFHPVDIVVFYRELVQQLIPEKELAQMIVDVMPKNERKHLKRFYAGKQVFEAGDNYRTIAHLVNEVFVPNYMPRLRESDDSKDTRVADGRNFAEGLRRTIAMRSDDPPMDQSKTPLIFISEECPQLIETIPALESDRDKNPEDTKVVGNEQDSIWEAAKTCFRECPSVVGGIPAHIRRQMAIAKGLTPQQMFLNAIEFDRKNSRPQRIIKRR